MWNKFKSCIIIPFNCCNFCISKKKKELKKNTSEKNMDMRIFNKKTIKILLIGDEDDPEVNKLKEHIENHFFTKVVKEKENNVTIYSDSNITLEITLKPFSLIHYCQDKYDCIFSFSKSFEENIEIIQNFKKTYYVMKRICSKNEILEESFGILNSTDLLLTNHFRKEINKILSLNSNITVSESTISESLNNSIDSINELKQNLINKKKTNNKNNIEEFLECPIGCEMMEDPVITPYGYTFERKNIVNAIKKTGKCPMTRNPLALKDLTTNYALKNVIDEYKKNDNTNSKK